MNELITKINELSRAFADQDKHRRAIFAFYADEQGIYKANAGDSLLIAAVLLCSMDKSEDVANMIKAVAAAHRNPKLRNKISEETQKYSEEYGINARIIKVSDKK